MRLETKGTPNTADRRLAQTCPSRQHATGPVRGALRLLFQRQPYHLLDLFVPNLSGRSWTGLVPQSRNALSDKSIAPKAHGKPGCTQLSSHGCVAQSGRTLQHDLGAKGDRPAVTRLLSQML